MDQAKEIRDVLKIQGELVHHRTVRDASPWLGLSMSTPQLKALILISEAEEIRMRDLTWRLGGSFSNATVLVDRLVEKGLVERLPEPQDRRVVLVRPTEKGRCLIEQLATSWQALSAPLLQTLDPEDLATVSEAFRVLLKAAQNNGA